jgi:acetyl esterase/lipase
VSWLLFALGLWCGLLLVNGFRPVRRNRVLFIGSFFTSWLTIEAAPAWLVLWPVVTGLLVWAGALDRWVGWIGLVLVAAWWVGLVVLYVQGRGTTATAAGAFGDFGRDVLDARENPVRLKVQVERNIEYRKAAGRRLKLDVYRPAGPVEAGARRPVVLQIHGGAWIIGDKREQGLPLLKYLASHGWVGFNVNYRLSPAATFPDHLVDLKAALVWIREHADDYGIDPDFVVVTGGSAGGHLTAMMALTANDPAYQPGFEDADTSVQAAVPFYGVYDFTDRQGTAAPEMRRWMLEPLIMKAFFDDDPEAFHRASPLDRIHPDAPPFLIVHGDKDTLAPVADARLFAEDLRAVSTSEVIYVELHGAQHAFDVFGSPRTRRMVQAVERFLFAVHDAYQHHPDAPLAPPRDGSAPPRDGSAPEAAGVEPSSPVASR